MYSLRICRYKMQCILIYVSEWYTKSTIKSRCSVAPLYDVRDSGDRCRFCFSIQFHWVLLQANALKFFWSWLSVRFFLSSFCFVTLYFNAILIAQMKFRIKRHWFTTKFSIASNGVWFHLIGQNVKVLLHLVFAIRSQVRSEAQASSGAKRYLRFREAIFGGNWVFLNEVWVNLSGFKFWCRNYICCTEKYLVTNEKFSKYQRNQNLKPNK